MMNKGKSMALSAAVMMTLLASSAYAEDQKPVYEVGDGESRGVRVTYGYLPDSHFKLHTQMGYVNDIELKPGEQVTYIAGGDTKRWLIDKAMVGTVQHVYIKPLEKGISTNIIINTNQRSYRFDVVETDGYDPLVTFRFPEDKKTSYLNKGSNRRENLRGDDGLQVNRRGLNFDYTIKSKKKMDRDLIPLEVFDDGEKTFIKMSPNNKYDLPVLYSMDPWDKNKLSMVNYRIKDGYYVADRVMEKGRLFYHQDYYVDFINEKKKPLDEKVIRQDAEAMKRKALREMDGYGDEWGASSDYGVMQDVDRQEMEQAREEARVRQEERRETLRKEEEQAKAFERQRIQEEQQRQKLERERLAKEEAIRREQEALRLEKERRAKEAAIAAAKAKEEERIRLEKIAEQERIRQEKERQRIVKEKEAERIRLAKLAEEERIRKEKIAEQERIRQEKERQEALRKAQEERERIAREEAARKAAEEKERERRMREAAKAKEELVVLRQKQAELDKQIQAVAARANGADAKQVSSINNSSAVNARRTSYLREAQANMKRQTADPAHTLRNGVQSNNGNAVRSAGNAGRVQQAMRPLVQPPTPAVLKRGTVESEDDPMVVLQDGQGNRRSVRFSMLPDNLKREYLASKAGKGVG